MKPPSFAMPLAASLALAPAAYANPITSVWRISDLSQFNYQTGAYETTSVPSAFDLTVTFPADITGAMDYGQTTITNFGELGETKFSSLLTDYVGSDPFGSGLTAQVAYAFPNVSDYDSTFFEEFAAQSNAYSPSGDQFWAYHIEVRVRRYTGSRGGAGIADYAFTTPLLLDFLSDAIVNPDDYQFIFNESWQIYDRATNEYLGGKSWSSYDRDVRLLAVSVPEPTSLSLLGAGLLAFAVRLHPKRKLAFASVEPTVGAA